MMDRFIYLYYSNPALWALYCAGAMFALGILVMFARGLKHKNITVPFVATVFLSTSFLYYPMVETISWVEKATELNPLIRVLAAAYYSFKPFMVDGNFAEVREWLTKAVTDSPDIIFWYELVYIALCSLAPLSIATAILSMFKDNFAYVRLYIFAGIKTFFSVILRFIVWVFKLAIRKYRKFRDSRIKDEDDEQDDKKYKKIYFQDVSLIGCSNIYAFSELNHKSLALAKDIKKTNKFSTFIFFDVYEKNEEFFVELKDEALDFGAIIFRKDILNFKANWWKIGAWCRIEFFLVGENESENVSQAIALTEKYKKRYNTQIFVWAINSESTAILDSINKVDYAEKNRKKADIDNPYGFKVRRVDDIEVYVWKALRDADLFKTADGKNRRFISLLIVGMGEYGMELLKTAVWMYQMEGVRLEINAFDITDKTAKKLNYRCPELLEKNDCTESGEAHYSIRIFDKVDVFENDVNDAKSFRNLLLSDNPVDQNLADRLRKTTDIFVALGEDDLNIRAAMELRKVFDQVAFKRNFPGIRDQYQNAQNEIRASYKLMLFPEVKTYKAVAGTMQRIRCLASGDGVKRVKYIDKECAEHVSADFKDVVNSCYDADSPRIFTQVYDQLKSQNIMRDSECILETHDCKNFKIQFKGSFGDQYRYDVITRKQEEEEAIKYHLRWSKTEEEKKKSKIDYNQYEYYRRSSMAQAVHKEMVTKSFGNEINCREKEPHENCKCAACCKSKRVEHMRWNAYMRSEGYQLPPEAGCNYKIKLSRAKYHYELVPYVMLTEAEKKKDETLRKSVKGGK